MGCCKSALNEAEEQLNRQHAELSDYFASRYLAGDLYYGSCYSNSRVGNLLTYEFNASDGDVMVWRHAFDLRAFGKQGEDVVTLYHYTDELAFLNIGNLEQTAAHLFASLKDKRAHFGKGLYATQHEPAVWGSRLRILLNNYSNGDPFSPTPEEAAKRDSQWGTGRGESGHRAAFCIPLIVPRSIAYNIFDRHTPDMAEKTVKDSAGQERPIKLGEDNEGQPTHLKRDVWVIRVEADGKVQDADIENDSIRDLLQRRLEKLRADGGEDLPTDLPTADCMSELAQRQEGRARYEEAEELYKECLRVRKIKEGEHHPKTLRCLVNFASLLQDQGRLGEAEALCREALEKTFSSWSTLPAGKAKLREDHAQTLVILQKLALLLQGQGRLAEADALCRKALKESRAKLGEDHPKTLRSLVNFASLLQDQGYLAKAEALCHKALKKSKAKLGEDHPQTLSGFDDLAALLHAQRRLAEALPIYRNVLERRKEKLGEDHPQTLGSLNTLASLLHDQGYLADAEDLFREALEKRKARLGEDHPQTLSSLDDLAVLLQAQGRLAEAEDLFCEALEKRKARLGEDHPKTLSSLNYLALLLTAQERVAEAKDLFCEALEKRKARLGEDHPQTLSSLDDLAVLLQAQGHLAEAEAPCREALEKRRPKLGNQHPTTMKNIYFLAVLLKSMKKFEEAEELFREHLAACRARHGEYHQETVDSMVGLAECLEECGKVDEAQELGFLPSEGRLKLGSEHPDGTDTNYSLAVLSKSMKKFEEAEERFRKHLAACRARHGKYHQKTLDSMVGLAECLEECGKVDEAQELGFLPSEGRLKLENEHPDGTDTNYSLADKSMKKFEEAEELFREHFAACRACHGERHGRTVSSRRKLVKFLEERGKVDAAQEVEIEGTSLERFLQQIHLVASEISQKRPAK